MTDPLTPNYKKDVGRLATDRFDFQKHIDGYTFHHKALDIDLVPNIVIGTPQTNVQDALIALKNALTVPLVPDASTTVKGVVQLNGDIGGTATNVSVIALRGYPVNTTPPTTNYVLTWNGTSWGPSPISGSFTFAGDVTGTALATTVVKINGKPVSGAVPSTNDVLTWNGTTWIPSAPIAGTVPTGTGFATVTSSAFDTAATANIRYTGGKFQTDSNIQFKNGANLGDLTWSPSTTRTLTLPNATDTLVGLATTDTLTNKTINATNNTITDTSTASGDLLLSNGTKFLRFAKGINGQFLGVTGGSVTWTTPSGVTPPAGTGFATVTSSVFDANATTNVRYTVGGKFQTDVNIQYNNSGITGDLAWVPTVNNQTLNLPNIQPSSTDTLVGKATTDVLTNKTVNATNNTVTDTGTALGDLLKSNGTKFVNFAKGTLLQKIRVNSGATDLEWVDTSNMARISRAFPSDANYTAVLADYAATIMEFTGTIGAQRNVVVPLTSGYQWTVFNNTTGGFGIQIIGTTGTGIVIANGKRAIVYADGTNIVRATADV